MLDSALPDVLRADQLLEIDGWYHFQVLQQTEYPNYFLSRLAGQGIKEILDRTFPVHCCVEDDRSVHGCMLTHMLTFVKVILATLLSWVLPAAFCPKLFGSLLIIGYSITRRHRTVSSTGQR